MFCGAKTQQDQVRKAREVGDSTEGGSARGDRTDRSKPEEKTRERKGEDET